MIREFTIIATLGLASGACTHETPLPPQSAEEEAAQPLEVVANEPATEEVAAEADPGGHASAHADGEMPWRSWEEGYAEAGENGQPMMVFVYAEWCARCRELEPVFSETPVIEAASELVTIRHDQDQGGSWIREVVGDSSTYVPRVIFLNPDGSMQDITSSHPRYPLFYTPSMQEDLIANMGQAGDRS